MKKIAPGGIVGILGGGQLGRMMSMAAARMGMDVVIYAPEADSCASRVSADTIVAAYDDVAKLIEFANRCDVITFEFENIPAATLDIIEKAGTSVFPKSNALGVSQDRLKEKEFLNSIGIPPAPFVQIDKAEDITLGLDRLGGRGVLKSRTDGYDGKGQVRLDSSSDPLVAWTTIGEVPAVLEAYISFDREISVLVVRGQDGDVQIYDTPENDHSGGILKSSRLPANISEQSRINAKELGRKLADSLDYVGVIALELFVMPDGSLLANEFAPRVHNTGHWTEEACLIGQFEQHMRAVCGWPLAPADRYVDIRMDNLLGDSDVSTWEDLSSDGAAPRIYAKRGGGEGRKLGHSNKILN